MVETRRSRKRRGSEQDTHDNEIEDVDLALDLASQMLSQRAKQRRIEAHARKPPFESLPEEIVRNVYMFLDTAKDVFSLANCSKYLRNIVTPEIAVRSAVFGGEKTRDAVNAVMDMVKKRSIHIPSTLRLLRLVNGKMCERGVECFSYDLRKKIPTALPKSGLRPFGLMICYACAKGASSSDLTYHRNRSGSLGHHDRVATSDGTRLFVQPFVEAATGESIGPIVFAKNVNQIESTYTFSEEERRQALDDLLHTIDANAPDDQASRAEAFVEAHKTAESRYGAFSQARLAVVSGKMSAKSTERGSRRLEKARHIFTKLEDLLDGYDHKDFVLDCHWDEQSGNCTFVAGPSDYILGRLLRAPSTATQKRIIDAVGSIRDVFDLLAANGFLNTGPSFLSFLSESQVRHERMLYRYCLAKMNPKTLLSNERFGGGRLVDLVGADGLVMSLHRALSHEDLAAAFAREVATPEDNFLQIALWMWGDNITTGSLEPGEAFTRICNQFESVKTAVQDYLTHPATMTFLQQTDPPSHRADQVFTRQNAVETIYTEKRCLAYLKQRNFQELRGLHKRFFLNPHNFGLRPDNAN